jgi:hypothetical protein
MRSGIFLHAIGNVLVREGNRAAADAARRRGLPVPGMPAAGGGQDHGHAASLTMGQSDMLTKAPNAVSSALDLNREPVMSDRPRVILLLAFGVLSALLVSPRLACAQKSAPGDTTWAALDITAALNNAINESKESDALREKVVRRISECSLMYGGLSTLTSNPESKKSYIQAQEGTMEVEATIAKPLQNQKRLELEEAARQSVATMLRGIKKEGEKEVGPLLKNCKALNDFNEMKSALQELSRQ